MNETFRNAPLVEIIAELRWRVPRLDGVDASGSPVQLPFVRADDATTAFFHRVTGAVAKLGFNRLEQLSPPGIPMLLPRMAYRYRRADEYPVLMQVGPGLFSVNALPPYKAWVEFRPWLAKGVDALLEAFADGEVDTPRGLTASLRYIDAFRKDLSGGRDAKAFATEVLGFRLELPAVLAARAINAGAIRAALQVTVPVGGMQATITLSDGKLADESAVLMNTDILVDDPLPPDSTRIVAAFDDARGVAHETFVGMTQSIRERLQPMRAGGG